MTKITIISFLVIAKKLPLVIMMKIKHRLQKTRKISKIFLRMRGVFYAGPWQSIIVTMIQRFSSYDSIVPSYSDHFDILDSRSKQMFLNENHYVDGIMLKEESVIILNDYFSQQPDYIKDPHLQNEFIQTIAKDPLIIGMTGNYLKKEPFLHSSYYLKSGVVVENNDTRRALNFHQDFPDFLSLSVMIYLNNVGIENGSHVLIPGSYKMNSIRQIFSIPSCSDYKNQEVKIFMGRRGTCFMENSQIYHKRMSATLPRKILMLNYTLQRRNSFF